MEKTILYFHGFASSSNSTKAKILKDYISKEKFKTQIITPDLSNSFIEACEQIEKLINNCTQPIVFMGSSLGGYYAYYFSNKLNACNVLINPAIPPLKGFEIYLGKNQNFSTGEEFFIKKEDISFLRSLSNAKLANKSKSLVLVETGDEIINYIDTVRFFKGSFIDITFGGNHSFATIDTKLEKITNFLEIS